MEPAGFFEDPRLAPSSPQPDFALIYSFLGSLFDWSCGSLHHPEVVEQMRVTDSEIAPLLMQNMISNLQHPNVSSISKLMLELASLPGYHVWQQACGAQAAALSVKP